MYLPRLYRKKLFAQVRHIYELPFLQSLQIYVINKVMVRLINRKNIQVFKNIIAGYMKFQEPRTHIVEFGNPYLKPCIYAMWHSDQFAIYGVKNKSEVSFLISTSIDGDIVAHGCETIGFKTVRGSSERRGAVEASMKMISLLKDGENVAITIDGPRGPYHTVKNGVIKIAKMSGAPIIPMIWYSEDKTFVTFPSWDKMTAPFFHAYIVNLYGEPIYVPEDADNEKVAEIKEKIKKSMEALAKKAPECYREAKKNKLWDKKS